MDSLLAGTGLVHDYYWFPPPSKGTSRFRPMLALARDIRAWKPDVLIYLHEQRGLMIALRDAAMFRLLGIRRLVGVPLTRRRQQRAFHEQSGRFEHRSEYLARSLAVLGDSKLAHRSSWDLSLSVAERMRAKAELAPLQTCPGVLAISVGTKIDVNDWGDDRWRPLLDTLSNHLPRWGLVALGARAEYARTSELLSAWRGPSLNLCGQLTVRESGAVMECMRIFIGHDSGPMHLAATVGTPCAAIFSARHLPGLWFPYGHIHKVFYNETKCAGCQLNVCLEFKKICIFGISVSEVLAGVVSMLSAQASSESNETIVDFCSPALARAGPPLSAGQLQS